MISGKFKIGIRINTIFAISEETGEEVNLVMGPNQVFQIQELDPSDFNLPRKEVRILKAVGSWPVGKEVIVPAGHADDLVSRGLAELIVVQPKEL